MVRYDVAIKNNSQNENLKQTNDEYLETTIQPFDSEITNEMSAEIELEMAETIYDMRREFKRANKQLRRFYSDKEPRGNKTEKVARGSHFCKRRALAQ
jgi:hypothetical protein